jgi:hypothetical protein
LHTKNQLYTLPGSALKVCVVVLGVEDEFSDQLWLWPSRTIIQNTPQYSMYFESMWTESNYSQS